MKKITAILTAFTMLFANMVFASGEDSASDAGTVIYVSASARSGGDGSFENPFISIENAQKVVRNAKKDEPVTVIIRGGKYYVKNSLEFTDACKYFKGNR